jgi:3-phosphoshikimate 1-carboxyvinyltransferase
MNKTLQPAGRLNGQVTLPADKSIAHRTALLSALADGTSTIEKFSEAADPQSTLACLRQLGITITKTGTTVEVHGRGIAGLRPAHEPIDCGNSGTTMRLLSGILAGQPFTSIVTGDASLRSRPMERIAEPLRKMGATVDLTDSHAPITILGDQSLHGIEYPLPVASAQVKSCVLLAGLYAVGQTTVIESTPSRDHTERMLDLSIKERDGARHITVRQGHTIAPQTWRVPRDFSAAAFFLVAGTIVPDSTLTLEGVGLNPTRNGLLTVLENMGADITVANERAVSGEPIGDLTVHSASLKGTTVDRTLIPNLIDEIPVLAVAATHAEGRTEVRGAEELRVKETDRIDAIVRNLRAMGADIEEFEDGFAVTGPQRLAGAEVDSYDDHRIAMAMGVAALTAGGTTTIREADCAKISFPGFWEQLEQSAVRT